MALAILIFFLIYPYTRFAYTDNISSLGTPGLNHEKITLTPGETCKLYIKGTNRRAIYSSSDFKVASVSFTGKVTCHRKGHAIIYVRQGKHTYKCKVSVIEKKNT